MRVLLITPDAPAPVHVNGGATRQYELYKRLIELGHSVTAVAVMPPHVDDFSDQLRADGFDLRPVWRPKNRLRDALESVLRHPEILKGLFTDSIDDLITRVLWVRAVPVVREALAEGPYDIVCFEHCPLWREKVKTDAPTLLDYMEVRSVQFKAKGEALSGFSGWLWRTYHRRVLKAERRITPRFTAAVTMSEPEAERMRGIVPGMPPIHVVGNGAVIDKFISIGPDPDENVVLFTGTMMFAPNISAADWLANKVWPTVLAAVPEATLQIAGRDPGPSTLALAELPGVSVHPNVPEMAPLYAGASVLTLPMHEGGGTRLKFAEAMAAGRPVVSTINGALGIAVEDGREALIRDDADGFAAAIIELLGDPARRAELGARGRETAIAEYDWRRLGDKFAAALEETIAAAKKN
ncbi:MAG: glycosyltransferase family 4 protein [Solirubrobacterales bacterium]